MGSGVDEEDGLAESNRPRITESCVPASSEDPITASSMVTVSLEVATKEVATPPPSCHSFAVAGRFEKIVWEEPPLIGTKRAATAGGFPVAP